MASPFVELEVDTPGGERTVKVTNPEKTYFAGLPEGRGRKIDLVEYYLAVADGVVRGLRERPTVLKRHPGGAETPPIYQKRVPDNRPPWLETVTVTFPSGRNATELCPVDVAHVAWAANSGCGRSAWRCFYRRYPVRIGTKFENHGQRTQFRP